MADGGSPAKVVDLESRRNARLEKAPPLRTADATVRDGRVCIRFGAEEVRLTPASARTWARNVLQLAALAETEGSSL